MSDDIAEAIGADIVIDTDAIDVGHLVAEHRAAIIEIKRLRAVIAAGRHKRAEDILARLLTEDNQT